MNTAPGASGGTAMPLMRACACGLRTKATSLRAGELDVGDELAAAGEMARVLLAQQRRADARPVIGCGLHHAVASCARLSPSASPARSAAAAAMAVTMLV